MNFIIKNRNKLRKTFEDYIEQFKRDNIDFDGETIPMFIDTVK